MWHHTRESVGERGSETWVSVCDHNRHKHSPPLALAHTTCVMLDTFFFFWGCDDMHATERERLSALPSYNLFTVAKTLPKPSCCRRPSRCTVASPSVVLLYGQSHSLPRICLSYLSRYILCKGDRTRGRAATILHSISVSSHIWPVSAVRLNAFPRSHDTSHSLC